MRYKAILFDNLDYNDLKLDNGEYEIRATGQYTHLSDRCLDENWNGYPPKYVSSTGGKWCNKWKRLRHRISLIHKIILTIGGKNLLIKKNLPLNMKNQVILYDYFSAMQKTTSYWHG